MGDRRYVRALDRIRRAPNRADAIRGLSDDEVVQALAAVSLADEGDPYLSNVLATEAMNRVHRSGTVARAVAEGLLSIDKAGRIAEANPSACRTLGKTRDELIGTPYLEHIHFIDADGGRIPESVCPVARAIRTGRPMVTEELVLGRAQGPAFPALVSVAPIMREEEREGVVLTFIDVTERRRAAEAARAERARLYRILDNLSEGVLLVSASGSYEYANTSALRMLQLGDEAVERLNDDRPSFELFDLNRTPIPRGRRVSQRVAATRAAVRGVQYRVRRRDGSWLAIEVDGAPVFDADGHFDGVVLSFDDITARLESAERGRVLASLVDHSTDAILQESTDGMILEWNDAAERLFGHAASEARGRPVSILVPSRLEDEHDELRARVVRGDAVPSVDTRRLRKDGVEIDVSLTLSPVRDSEGNVTSLSAIYRDVSERKRAEDALEKTTEELAELTAVYEALLAAQGALDVGYVLLKDREVVASNDAFLRLSGYSREELRAIQGVDEVLAVRRGRGGRRALGGRRPARATLRQKSGKRIAVDLVVEPVPGSDVAIGIVKERDRGVRSLL